MTIVLGTVVSLFFIGNNTVATVMSPRQKRRKPKTWCRKLSELLTFCPVLNLCRKLSELLTFCLVLNLCSKLSVLLTFCPVLNLCRKKIRKQSHLELHMCFSTVLQNSFVHKKTWFFVLTEQSIKRRTTRISDM